VITAIVGAGRGCRSLLELLLERGLVEFRLDVKIVCDLRSHAPGIVYAARHGIETSSRLEDVFRVPGLELVVELTGDDRTAREIQAQLPPGVRMLDHVLARIFWDQILLEEKLDQERAHVQQILDSMPDIVLVLDREMRILSVNAAFTNFTGLSRSSARGQFCHQVLCRRDGAPSADDAFCPFTEALATGMRVSMVQTRECIPGSHDFFEITMTPVRDAHGEIVQVVEALHPITERVRLTREVEESAQRFRQFIDSAYDLISIKDLSGRYQVMNEATARFFGRPRDGNLGKTVHEVYPVEIAELVAAHDREVIRRGEPVSYEEMFVIDGREHELSTVRFPLRDYKGDIVGVCTISRDTTAEKRLQRELLQADKLAAIGKLAAGVAHEINNPLTGILAFAEDLKEEVSGEEQREDCDVIIRETLRCREIVRNLLDFARQKKPQIRGADLNRVVQDTVVLVRRLALFRDVKLTLVLGEALPVVPGDPGQLQQVVLNLLVNAAEGMDGKGEIIVATSLRAGVREVMLSVSDTGPGIPEEALGRIFEPFFSTKKATHGLGLAVSWGIVERHGGRVEADNRPEGGAVFRVFLPAGEERS
jgi:PAS domain S-box-containing protein